MAEASDIAPLIESIGEPARRAEAETLIGLMQDATGLPPASWGKMIGFGRYRYRYDSGHAGESFLVGFAPRASEFSIYLCAVSAEKDVAARNALLERLGKHRVGKGCLYVKRLSDIDLAVLAALIEQSVAVVRQTHPD